MKKSLLLILAITMSFLSTGCIYTTVDGEHVGYITAAEKNGIIWKTGRIYVKTDTSSSQEDKYCVENEETFSDLKDAQTKKTRVKIIFHDELFVAPWRCSPGTGEIGIVDSVTFL